MKEVEKKAGMDTERIRAAVPDRMPTRTENESQLGQLIRWWSWVRDQPIDQIDKVLEISRDTLYRGLRLPDNEFSVMPKLWHSLRVKMYEDFGAYIDIELIKDLARRADKEEPVEWTFVAAKLQKSWKEEKDSTNE